MLQRKTYTRLLMRAAPLLNAPVTAMATSARFGRIVSRNVAIITYTGRRSGQTFSFPVAYRRRGDELEITANMPDAKTWWRNFVGDGAPLTVRLHEVERDAHAVAQRGENGGVTVRVQLYAS